MANMIEFATNELNRILDKCEDKEGYELQKQINKNILEVVEVFSKQGHSGFSASYAINILERLLKFLPINALTGEDDEWIEVSNYFEDKNTWQNKRCSSVFKHSDGKCYHNDAKVFSDDGGRTWYTSKDSRIEITFPYNVPSYPERVIIDNEAIRQSILDKLVRILNHSFKINCDNITEDTYIRDIIPVENIENLEFFIRQEWMISNFSNKVDADDQMWNIVKYIMNSIEEED